MTEMTCLSCTATTTNGLALCERCQIAASVYLEFFPVYFRNLARWRPGRAGGRPVPSSRIPTSGATEANDRVSRALDEAGNALTTWARKLNDDRGVELPQIDGGEAEQVAALSRWFAEHLTSVATLDWCGEFICDERHEKGAECDGLGHHEHRLRSLTIEVAPGWYAGECHQCRMATHVIPGLTWVTCGTCGLTTYARDHLDAILDEARGWIARPKAIAEALVALLDTEQSVERLYGRIRKWESLGWVTPIRRLDVDGDPTGPKCYLLGDVVDLALRNADAVERMTPA